MSKSYTDKRQGEQSSRAPSGPPARVAHASERRRVREVLDAPAAGVSLRVAPVHAPSEVEADRVAQRLLDASAPAAMERTASAPAGTTAPLGAELEAQILAAQSHGDSLSGAARRFFEPRLGSDLGEIRIHADAQAEAANRALESRAFTVGRDIFFGPEEYRPDSSQGRALLAHELAHATRHAPAVIHRKATEPARTKEKVRAVRIVITGTTTGDLRPIERRMISAEDIPDTVPMRGLTNETTPWIFSEEQFEIPLYVAKVIADDGAESSFEVTRFGVKRTASKGKISFSVVGLAEKQKYAGLQWTTFQGGAWQVMKHYYVHGFYDVGLGCIGVVQWAHFCETVRRVAGGFDESTISAAKALSIEYEAAPQPPLTRVATKT